MSNFLIGHLEVRQKCEYDLIFCTSGSEQRCTHWHEAFNPSGKRKIAWAYSRDTDSRASVNQKYFAKNKFDIINEGILTARQVIRGMLQSFTGATGVTIAIDVSSMTRELMATWISELNSHRFAYEIKVDFVYSRAKFSPPSKSSGLADKPVPVIPEFAGIWNDPEKPLLLILGVGYEPYLATSFCEFLDPSSVVAFIPTGHEQDYTTEISRQNKDLLKLLVNRHELLIKYDVEIPINLYIKLESVVFGRKNHQRINIAPYGLKTFALCSFLVAARYAPQVMVWHLNPSRIVNKMTNRIAAGDVTGITAIFKSYNNLPESQ